MNKCSHFGESGAAGVRRPYADMCGADWMKRSDLEAQMQNDGYTALVVGADDVHWEREAGKDDKIVEFHPEARSGKITKSMPETKE